MRLIITLATIAIITSSLLAQVTIAWEEIDSTKISAWNDTSSSTYQGVYHFGNSESESDLLLILDKGYWQAQLHFNVWDSTGNGTWKKGTAQLSQIQLMGNKFLSKECVGEFVTYQFADSVIRKGLYLFDKCYDEFGPIDDEIGLLQSMPPLNFFSGRFPQTSSQRLEKMNLQKYSLDDLKIMRNEIFARYGFIFRKNGEMERYFSQQDWYQPQHQNVDAFLTPIEMDNIAIIRQVEAMKKKRQ